MRKKRKLVIDSTKGGNGDIWMRLVSFYSIASLLPRLEICLLVPPFLRNLAFFAFGDRVTIMDGVNDDKPNLTYTSLGLKDLIDGIGRGKRYVSPYQRAVIHDKKTRRLKDRINVALFNVADLLGWVQVPHWKWIKSYQGYLDIIGIKALRTVDYQAFVSGLRKDYDTVYARLNEAIPVSPELLLPLDIGQNIVVFPTGTSRQFIPVAWASKYLPDAYYAFFYKDKEAEAFQQQGLKTVFFFHEPGDIITLAKGAKWTISTDSFPSHLLQYSSKRCTITITEVLKSRIISPVFKGKVIDAEVACHPCLHLDRKSHPTCAAGYAVCQNWKSSKYTENLLKSVIR